MNRENRCNINVKVLLALSFYKSIRKDIQQIGKTPAHVFALLRVPFFFFAIQIYRFVRLPGSATLGVLHYCPMHVTVFLGSCPVLIIFVSRFIFFHITRNFHQLFRFLLLNNLTKWRFYTHPHFHLKECICCYNLFYSTNSFSYWKIIGFIFL